MKKCTTYTLGKTVISSEYDEFSDFDMYGKYGDKVKPVCIIRGDNTFLEDHVDDDDYDMPLGRFGEYSFFR